MPKEEEQVFIRGRVPENIRARFKATCALLGRDMSGVLKEIIERWLSENQPPPPSTAVESGVQLPETLAELVQQNFYQLLTDGKITTDKLKAIASGSKPNVSDLSKIAHTLDIPEEQLVAMRDQDFPTQKRKQS